MWSSSDPTLLGSPGLSNQHQPWEGNSWSTHACFPDSAHLQDLLASGMQVGIPIIMRYELNEGSVEIKSNGNLVITRNKDEVKLWQYFQRAWHWNCMEILNSELAEGNVTWNSENECDYRKQPFIYIAIIGNVVRIHDAVQSSSKERHLLTMSFSTRASHLLQRNAIKYFSLC